MTGVQTCALPISALLVAGHDVVDLLPHLPSQALALDVIHDADGLAEGHRLDAANQRDQFRQLLGGIGEEVTKDNASVNGFYKRLLTTGQKF